MSVDQEINKSRLSVKMKTLDAAEKQLSEYVDHDIPINVMKTPTNHHRLKSSKERVESL